MVFKLGRNKINMDSVHNKGLERKKTTLVYIFIL